ncbi:MAG TPA: class I SAM-dependent DNA methyltransferase [Chitinophagaceae bacterium]
MIGEGLKQLEADLWEAADQLRANSKLTATEYTMPILGLIFLRHAANRFEQIKQEVEPTLPVHPKRGRRPINRDDFWSKGAIFLPQQAQFDYLVGLPESEDIGAKIDNAMRLIEEENESLKGVLPKTYTSFEKSLLLELLRIFNKEALRKASGDVFGKIYEYFLNAFAIKGAQEGGEFFTPISLVSTIVNFIEPDHGIVLDPACGSFGMAVQTGHFIESLHKDPNKQVMFYGQEKTSTNANIAKMNMAVHGLEGNVLEGNTFYEDKHELVGKCDFVMANPPFNVDKVDKEREVVKKDPRLPFGLPKNDNGNYLWIQYFYGYLNDTGRAGFVMASSASDAGHSEKLIREKLIKTGAVDIMVSISNNFFYTRSLPCTLWFYDRAKENDKKRKDKILMLDARKVYRKVSTTINDFSPEQLQNLTAIVKLYRGDQKYFSSILHTRLCFAMGELKKYEGHLEHEIKQVNTIAIKVQSLGSKIEFDKANDTKAYKVGIAGLCNLAEEISGYIHKLCNDIREWQDDLDDWEALLKDKQNAHNALNNQWLMLHNLHHQLHPQIKHITHLYKQWLAAWEAHEKEYDIQRNKEVLELKIKTSLRIVNEQHEGNLVVWRQLKYLVDESGWLLKRFVDGEFVDVPGLCKMVSIDELAAKDYSLSPGRYVGIDTSADIIEDWEDKLQIIHTELDILNTEAMQLAEAISSNYKTIM